MAEMVAGFKAKAVCESSAQAGQEEGQEGESVKDWVEIATRVSEAEDGAAAKGEVVPQPWTPYLLRLTLDSRLTGL